MIENKEFYPIFSVDICQDNYAIHYVMVGAKDKNDLLEHFNDIFKPSYPEIKKKMLVKDDYRITLVKDMYTDKPYKILDHYAYYE